MNLQYHLTAQNVSHKKASSNTLHVTRTFVLHMPVTYHGLLKTIRTFTYIEYKWNKVIMANDTVTMHWYHTHLSANKHYIIANNA